MHTTHFCCDKIFKKRGGMASCCKCLGHNCLKPKVMQKDKTSVKVHKILDKLDKDFHKEFDSVINDGGELQTHYLDVIEWFKDEVKKIC